jgi:hypothetical protein
MTATYGEMGQRLVQSEQQGEARAEYGQQLVEQLAKDLSRQQPILRKHRAVAEQSHHAPKGGIREPADLGTPERAKAFMAESEIRELGTLD